MMSNRQFLDAMIEHLWGKDRTEIEASYWMWKDDITERVMKKQPLFDPVTLKEISGGKIVN